MKETVANECNLSDGDRPCGEDLLDGDAVRLRSLIVWGEHCTECAYPVCYGNCAFYDPRPDLHCRRFLGGIEAAGPGLVRIRFRKWGKLEGRGPAPLYSYGDARRRERLDAAVSRFLARAPAPFALGRSAAWRWNARKAGAGRRRAQSAPDAFVVEGWSRDGADRGFTLTFLQDKPEPAAHQTHFLLGPNLSRHVVTASALSAAIQLDQPYRIQIEPVGSAEGVDVMFGLIDFVSFTETSRPKFTSDPGGVSRSSPAKVLVWDLDETLWSGTLAEDGAAGVVPRSEAVEAIKALDGRGVLQSIASKNDSTEALEVLRRHGLADYFLHPEINWGPKSQSIGRIARRLDLGLDSVVFIDDQAFERAEVAAGLPKVRTLPHTDVAALLDNPWFDLPSTSESGRRRSLYQAEARRTAAMEDQGHDYLAFLRASELTLDLRPLSRTDATRVHELSQRTNQLNFTGAKFALDEVEAMAAPDARRARLTLRCADRYGDYGLIGFADLALDAAELSNFFMSCRVQRKRVEAAVFAYLAEQLRAKGHDTFGVRFHATERNGASVRLLEDLGFERASEGWVRDLSAPFADSDIVRLVIASPQPA